MFSLCCSPLFKPEKCRTFLLTERMLQMSANESCGNDLWPKLLLAGRRNKSPRRPGAPAAPVDSIISLELRNWFLWFARDSEGLAAAPDGEARWLRDATGSLLLSDRWRLGCESAPNDAPSVMLTADSWTSDAATSLIKLYGCFCWRRSKVSLRSSAVSPCSADTRPSSR